jgi:hypothetical protein
MKTSFLFALILISCIACKKKENTTTSSSPTSGNGPTNDTYQVLVNSNFLRSKMSIDNITDGLVIKKYNTSVNDSVKNCPITYTFTGISSKKFRVYTTSVKNATDTTLYMTDGNLTWNYLQVKKNGVVIYEKKDTVGYGGSSGSQRITSNECLINY